MIDNLKFKDFLVESHEKFMNDVKDTIMKMPKSHRDLIKSYKFEKEDGNTLKGDDGHVGVIDEKKKKITVAAPWHYSREHTILHEFAHAVWKYVMSLKLRKNWSAAVKKAKSKNKEGLDQNDEELFCMIYAQFYAKNKLVKFDHPELNEFISKLPK